MTNLCKEWWGHNKLHMYDTEVASEEPHRQKDDFFSSMFYLWGWLSITMLTAADNIIWLILLPLKGDSTKCTC